MAIWPRINSYQQPNHSQSSLFWRPAVKWMMFTRKCEIVIESWVPIQFKNNFPRNEDDASYCVALTSPDELLLPHTKHGDNLDCVSTNSIHCSWYLKASASFAYLSWKCGCDTFQMWMMEQFCSVIARISSSCVTKVGRRNDTEKSWRIHIWSELKMLPNREACDHISPKLKFREETFILCG